MIQPKWKPIDGFPKHLISDDGRIYSTIRNRELTIWDKPNKYPRATLEYGDKKKTFSIHRLVAKAFIPNPMNKRTVNHKDGNKNNNHVSNLEWNTLSENTKHAFDTGLFAPPKLPSGENHPAAKLNNVDVAMIKVLLKHDFTQDQIAKRFNIHPVHVSQIKLKKTWKHILA